MASWDISERKLSRRKALDWLGLLQPSSSDAFTLLLSPSNLGDPNSQLDPEHMSLMTEMEGVVPHLRERLNGAVVFWDPEEVHIILPPFPLEREQSVQPGWSMLPLRMVLETPHKYAVLALRLGRYAIGVYQSEELLDSKTDARYVKGRHKAGGQSQHRFARSREKQARELFDTTCAMAKKRLCPHEKKISRLFLAGDRHTLNAFLKRCPYLRDLAPRTSPHLLDIRKANHAALLDAPTQVYQTMVYTLHPRNNQEPSSSFEPACSENWATLRPDSPSSSPS
jgi:hypothetical protein